MFAVAVSHEPSSNRAWVSNSKVEKVVNAPRNPTPSARRIASEFGITFCVATVPRTPRRNESADVDHKGAQGKPRLEECADETGDDEASVGTDESTSANEEVREHSGHHRALTSGHGMAALWLARYWLESSRPGDVVMLATRMDMPGASVTVHGSALL